MVLDQRGGSGLPAFRPLELLAPTAGRRGGGTRVGGDSQTPTPELVRAARRLGAIVAVMRRLCMAAGARPGSAAPVSLKAPSQDAVEALQGCTGLAIEQIAFIISNEVPPPPHAHS